MLREHKAGEKRFVDYAGLRVTVEIGGSGETHKAQSPVEVLGGVRNPTRRRRGPGSGVVDRLARAGPARSPTKAEPIPSMGASQLSASHVTGMLTQAPSRSCSGLRPEKCLDPVVRTPTGPSAAARFHLPPRSAPTLPSATSESSVNSRLTKPRLLPPISQ